MTRHATPFYPLLDIGCRPLRVPWATYGSRCNACSSSLQSIDLSWQNTGHPSSSQLPFFSKPAIVIRTVEILSCHLTLISCKHVQFPYPLSVTSKHKVVDFRFFSNWNGYGIFGSRQNVEKTLLTSSRSLSRALKPRMFCCSGLHSVCDSVWYRT